jgi:hypothetical protein
VLAGCLPTSDGPPALSAPAAVAVGSSATGWISFPRCKTFSDNDHDTPSCMTIRVPLQSAHVDAAETFHLESDEDSIRYTALAPGTAQLTVIAADDDRTTLTRTIVAAVPDRVDAGINCMGSRAFGTNEEVVASFELFARSTELHHSIGVNPLESSFLILQPEKTTAAFGEAFFLTPGTPGTGSITSRFDPTLDIELVVFSVDDVTGMEIDDVSNTPGRHIQLGSTGVIDGTYLMIGNREPTCTDHYARTLRVLTPATCQIWDRTQHLLTLGLVGHQQFSLRGLALGDCTVELSLDGTTQVVRKTFAVKAEPNI